MDLECWHWEGKGTCLPQNCSPLKNQNMKVGPMSCLFLFSSQSHISLTYTHTHTQFLPSWLCLCVVHHTRKGVHYSKGRSSMPSTTICLLLVVCIHIFFSSHLYCPSALYALSPPFYAKPTSWQMWG